MKIAITGGTAGIGKALGDVYEAQGHEVLRLSRRTGHNIVSITKIATVIETCDMFINNAQQGYAQTDLLFEMARRWQGTWKKIMVISTMMTQDPVCPLPGLDMDAYRLQKATLEEAVKQIRNRKLGIRLFIVRPGDIATRPEKTVPPSAALEHWAQTLVGIFDLAGDDLIIPDISLGPIFRPT
jgi:NAD(P)-dependent dehydrogenase (short-subunit alcohol dehydrogenase family)